MAGSRRNGLGVLCVVGWMVMWACVGHDDATSESTQQIQISGEDGLVASAVCASSPTYMPGITGDSGYGCFCGPGNSKGMDAAPLDPMDTCCKNHDLRWTEIEERYRAQGNSCDCRAVKYEVDIKTSGGTPVGVGIEGIPYTIDPILGLGVPVDCTMTCATVANQPGATNSAQECALECCEDARVMNTCMAVIPKDVPGVGSIGLGRPGAFEPYDPIFPQPNWGAWNPRYSPDPLHPRGPDPAGNLGRCLENTECGDGVCDYVEASRCSCPADCGPGQGLPPAAAPAPAPILAPVVEPAPLGPVAPRIEPGVPFPGMDPGTNLPIGGIGSAKPYCPIDPAKDGICVRIVSEGRADGPADPDCPPDSSTCTLRSEDLYETSKHEWLRVKDNLPPHGCGTTGQVFEIGYQCADPAGFAAAKAWIAAWCQTPPDTIKDPGIPGVCEVDPTSIYKDNTWDIIFGTSSADRCVTKCNATGVSCQGDPISVCEWGNSCRAACAAGLGEPSTPATVCAVRPVPITPDTGLVAACTTGTAQANAATVSTYGLGTVTCYDYSTSTWSRDWGVSATWQKLCTDAANLNYPAGANRDEQIRCCMDRMTTRCRTE